MTIGTKRRINKTTWTVIITLLATLLASCGEGGVDEKRYAFVTDQNGAATENIAQSWAGTQDAAQLAACQATIYTPDAEEGSVEDEVRAASRDGAKVIVMAGDAMAKTAVASQEKYNKIRFILADAWTVPQTAGDGQNAIHKNMCIVRCNEEEAGYLTGYALAAEGYKELGFLGGAEDARGRNYMNGFIKGAEQAATENALSPGIIRIRVAFAGDGSAGPTRMDAAMEWYDEGTQVIFAPDTEIRRSVEKAAELTKEGMVCGVSYKDVDSFSERQLTMAVQDYETVVSRTIRSYEEDTYKGGQIVTFGAIDGCVKLAADYGKFHILTDTMSQLAVNNLRNGVVVIPAEDASAGTSHVQVISE